MFPRSSFRFAEGVFRAFAPLSTPCSCSCLRALSKNDAVNDKERDPAYEGDAFKDVGDVEGEVCLLSDRSELRRPHPPAPPLLGLALRASFLHKKSNKLSLIGVHAKDCRWARACLQGCWMEGPAVDLCLGSNQRDGVSTALRFVSTRRNRHLKPSPA